MTGHFASSEKDASLQRDSIVKIRNDDLFETAVSEALRVLRSRSAKGALFFHTFGAPR